MSAYADYPTYLLYAPGDTGAPDVIETALLASSRQIERACGRFFGQDGSTDEPATRLYRTRPIVGPMPVGWAESENPYRYGGWTRLLSTDDLVSVDSIVIDEGMDGSFSGDTALATTDYELWEPNAPYGAEPRPYEGIYIPPYSTSGGFRPGAQIRVTGIFGWPAVPAPIVEMTCRLTALRRNALDPARAGVTGISVAGGPSISYGNPWGAGSSSALPKSYLDDLAPYRKAASVL